MEHILFMMPSYYHFNEVVADGLAKHSQFNINSIDTVGNQAYRHVFDRGINFLSKVFLNKNLKPEMKRKLFIELIDKYPQYEYLVVNRPDIINDEILAKAFNKSKKKILLLWDSLEKIPISEDLIAKFDEKYSFDSWDCSKYGFKKIENFHFFEKPKVPLETNLDVVFLGTLDKRIDDLKKILTYLINNGKKAKAYIYVPSGKSLKKQKDIEILDAIVPFKNSDTYSLSGNIILDLAHQNQRGLSFRVFEAMAFNKKLITTNKYIKEYDLYNENNIFIIEDIDNISIPDTFWDSPYYNLQPYIIEKYHVKTWVERILNGK